MRRTGTRSQARAFWPARLAAEETIMKRERKPRWQRPTTRVGARRGYRSRGRATGPRPPRTSAGGAGCGGASFLARSAVFALHLQSKNSLLAERALLFTGAAIQRKKRVEAWTHRALVGAGPRAIHPSSRKIGRP